LVVNGIRIPKIGERYLLFLTGLSDSQLATFGSRATHRLSSFAGLLRVSQSGMLSSDLADLDHSAHLEVAGRDLEEVLAKLDIPGT